MSDFKVYDANNAPDDAKSVIEQAQTKFGFVPNILGVMAEAPCALKAYTQLSSLMEDTSFNSTERQIILMSVSYVNECDYCMAAHSVISNTEGVDEKVVQTLREGGKIEDSKLEALRALSVEITETCGNPNKEAIQQFYDAGYGNKQLLEVILGVTMKTLSNYINHIAETPLDDNFSKYKWEKK